MADGIDTGKRTTVDAIACSLVNPRYDKQEQEMSHNTSSQFSDLVTRLTSADGTLAEAHSHEILDTELAREVLEAIVGGRPADNPYGQGGIYYDHPGMNSAVQEY